MGAASCRTDPSVLLLTLARELLAGDDFHAACAELAAALILDGAAADYSNALADRVHPAIVAEGRQAAGEHRRRTRGADPRPP